VATFVEELGKLWRAAGGSEWALLGVIAVLALLVLGLKVVGAIQWPKAPPPSPDLVENPPSPPIRVRDDGSIPVSNPEVPPDPLP
jgi:hypothetical protein